MLGIDQFDTLATELLGMLAGLLHTPMLRKAPGYHRLIDSTLANATLLSLGFLGQTGHWRTSEPTGHQASGHPLEERTAGKGFI
jgi:hypothetical protein